MIVIPDRATAIRNINYSFDGMISKFTQIRRRDLALSAQLEKQLFNLAKDLTLEDWRNIRNEEYWKRHNQITKEMIFGGSGSSDLKIFICESLKKYHADNP